MNRFYKVSDYRQNKKSPHIVYGSVAGEATQITQQQFLEENPHLSPEDI